VRVPGSTHGCGSTEVVPKPLAHAPLAWLVFSHRRGGDREIRQARFRSVLDRPCPRARTRSRRAGYLDLPRSSGQAAYARDDACAARWFGDQDWAAATVDMTAVLSARARPRYPCREPLRLTSPRSTPRVPLATPPWPSTCARRPDLPDGAEDPASTRALPPPLAPSVFQGRHVRAITPSRGGPNPQTIARAKGLRKNNGNSRLPGPARKERTRTLVRSQLARLFLRGP
jgi:hypothetical protein